ncbi:MAG: adenylosuccinate synthase [Coriobacteriia bacterium]|nr:adenylosuccinate synthase [Coriobacteriia bacterium]
MAGTVLVGAQWGDEGKGKITDLIAPDFDYVVRYQGGNNAGHTVVHGDITLALHLVPSGIMYPQVIPVIANGCVLDLKVLLKEIDTLAAAGFSTDRLQISGNAHIIMPWHIALDGASEIQRGASEIGTTRRGIGPTYEHKAARNGIRMQDLLDPNLFRAKVAASLETANAILTNLYEEEPIDADMVCAEYLEMATRVTPYITDTALLLNSELAAGRKVLFEGAQGTLLDIDHGTYPYVTSSNCTAGGAITGTGVGPMAVKKILGVAKAYITRVGSGPFPTELDDDIGAKMVEIGGEFGTTTGRMRRCGWHDSVITRYAAMVNGLTDLCITKLDVLGFLDKIKICVAYEIDGQSYTTLPGSQSLLERAVPVYEEMPGWETDISAVKRYEDLPIEARNYLERLEELAGVPVTIVSVGPERGQTIMRGWQSL